MSRNKHTTLNEFIFMCSVLVFGSWIKEREPKTSTLLMNIISFFKSMNRKQARYSWIYFRFLLHMNIFSFFIHEPKTSTLHMNISRSLIHEPKTSTLLMNIFRSLIHETENKHTRHEYISFFYPQTETSMLLMNIFRSLIHEPKEARYSWIYFVLTTHEYISFFYPQNRSMNRKQARYSWIYFVLTTHEYIFVLYPWAENKHTTHEYISFL